MKFASVLFVLVGLSVATGCTQASLPEDEMLGDNEEAMIVPNALIPNALIPNALIPNALIPNALIPNALIPNALIPNALTALKGADEAGELSRMFVRYTVACAFKPNQSFQFSWTDGDAVVHNEQYVGVLGIAPQWAHGPLNLHGQQMVSACLGALTNYYGVHVLISVRSDESPLRLHSNSSELTQYPNVEGAFWGNIFAAQPRLNACFNSTNVDNSRDLMRDCAAGHLNSDGTVAQCGPINIVGSCKSICKKFDSAHGDYEDCLTTPGSSNKRTDLVITTALP